jgi:putative endopeptidase
MTLPLRFATLFACSLLCFVACSDEDETQPRDDEDAGADSGTRDKDAGTTTPDTGPATSKPADTKKASIAPWGFDLEGMDDTARPGQSFYSYANGHWLSTHEIPSDRTSYSTFVVLATQSEAQVHDIVEGLDADADEGSAAQKVHDFYRSYLDSDGIEKKGLEPARAGLDAIGAARTHEDLVALMARPDLSLLSPIGIGITIDDKDPDRYRVQMAQSGLGLPDREYYLDDSPVYRDLVASYEGHIARMLGLIEEPDPQGKARAIVELETQIAERSWAVEKRRDSDATYNLRTREQLEEKSGDFPWAFALDKAGVAGEQDYIVREIDAVENLAQHFTTVSVETWVAYFKYHYIQAFAPLLPKAFDDEIFEFYNKKLNGQPAQRERWKRAIASVNSVLGEAVGQLYVEEHFPPSYKEQMLKLVENLRAAFGERIAALEWMSADTKEAAKKKLQTFVPKIGYPDKWKDYSGLDVREADAFGNAARANEWAWKFDLDRLGKPTDRGEWFMNPQTVNAYYNSTFNEVVFPAAILQPPFFDPYADPAVNYGGIGGVIGHEMGHGFDDQGAKSDERGVLRDWWKPEDEQAFGQLVDKLVAQYDTYEVLPGLHINGRLTVGENIGDLGGLSVAYEAYHKSLDGKPAPVLDELSGDQRFFLSWAQAWRDLSRDERLRNLVMSDPHSPPRFRVDGVVRNIDAWYEAFDIQPSDALYLAPEDRVHIW